MRLFSIGALLFAANAIAIAGVGAGCSQRECNAQNDCPLEQGCTVDGKCVEIPKRARAVPGASSDASFGGNSANDDGNDDANGGGGANGDVPDGALTGTVDGRVGALQLKAVRATVNVSGQGFQFVTVPDNEGMSALVLLELAGNDTRVIDGTPGTYHFSASDLDSAGFGVGCNRDPSGQSSYDVTGDADVTVGPPSANGEQDVSLHLVINAAGDDTTSTDATAHTLALFH